MYYRVLLINPWVHDFSCLNLWSAPLGLLEVAKYLSQFNVELYLIDCLETIRYKSFGTGKYHREEIKKPHVLKSVPRKFCRYGISHEEFYKRLSSVPTPDIILITSIMTYWYTGVGETIEEIKRFYNARIPIILGGIYATILPEHALKVCHPDAVYTGPVEEGFSTFLNTFGIKLKKIRPEIPYYKLNFNRWRFAPMLTSRGCPFHCIYCASNMLCKNFSQRDPEEIIKEILELNSSGIEDFAFYDDALLINSERHIKPLLKEIIKTQTVTSLSIYPMRFHTPNGLHARFIDEELAFLMKKAGFKTVRISLETVSPERQKNTGGKISTEEFKKAIDLLKKAGFSKSDLGVYLMFGLPGQDLQEVIEGVRFLKSLNVRIHLTEYSPIPKTQLWYELINSGIISYDTDPLLTNNSIFYYLFYNYNIKSLEELKLEVKKYNES